MIGEATISAVLATTEFSGWGLSATIASPPTQRRYEPSALALLPSPWGEGVWVRAWIVFPPIIPARAGMTAVGGTGRASISVVMSGLDPAIQRNLLLDPRASPGMTTGRLSLGRTSGTGFRRHRQKHGTVNAPLNE